MSESTGANTAGLAGIGYDQRPPRREYYHLAHAPVAGRIVVSASACVFDETGALLMIRRADTGSLSLPGGAQEVGETVSHAAVREVKEETGVNIEVTELLGVYSDPDYVIAYPDGEVGQEFSVCFLARSTGGQVRVSAESSDVHWVPRQDLDTVDVPPAIAVRIADALESEQGPHFT